MPLNAPFATGRLMGAERTNEPEAVRAPLEARAAPHAPERAMFCPVNAGAAERVIELPLQPRSPWFPAKAPG